MEALAPLDRKTRLRFTTKLSTIRGKYIAMVIKSTGRVYQACTQNINSCIQYPGTVKRDSTNTSFSLCPSLSFTFCSPSWVEFTLVYFVILGRQYRPVFGCYFMNVVWVRCKPVWLWLWMSTLQYLSHLNSLLLSLKMHSTTGQSNIFIYIHLCVCECVFFFTFIPFLSLWIFRIFMPQPCFSHSDSTEHCFFFSVLLRTHYMTSRISRMLSLLPQRLLALVVVNTWRFALVQLCDSPTFSMRFFFASSCIFTLHFLFAVVFFMSRWICVSLSFMLGIRKVFHHFFFKFMTTTKIMLWYSWKAIHCRSAANTKENRKYFSI